MVATRTSRYMYMRMIDLKNSAVLIAIPQDPRNKHGGVFSQVRAKKAFVGVAKYLRLSLSVWTWNRLQFMCIKRSTKKRVKCKTHWQWFSDISGIITPAPINIASVGLTAHVLERAAL